MESEHAADKGGLLARLDVGGKRLLNFVRAFAWCHGNARQRVVVVGGGSSKSSIYCISQLSGR